MKFLQNLWRRNIENPSVPLNQAIKILQSAPQSYSGVRVTQDVALSNPAVWRGVNLISSHVGKLPLNVYRRGENDSRERATNHPAYKLLRTAFSDTVSAFTGKQTLQHHALLFGNGYAWILRDEFAKPTELVILDPTTTTPARENGRLVYVVDIGNGQKRKLSPADVLHIKGIGNDGMVGFSIIDLLQNALGYGVALQRYGSTYFRNNAKPSIVVELPPNIRTPEQVEDYRRAWNNIHEGLDNSWRPAMAGSGTKIHPLGSTNNDGQYIESMQHDLVMVASIIGCKPHMLGSTQNSSYKSLESENRAFLSDCLDQHLVCWEQECYLKLMSERQKERDTHFFEFERKALIGTDTKLETDILIAQYTNGLLSWEECRQILNRSSVRDENQIWMIPTFLQDTETVNPKTDKPEESQDETDDTDEETQDETTDKTRQALNNLKKTTVQRLVKRLSKSVEGGQTDLEKHRSVILQNLEPFQNAAEWTDNLLARLQPEINYVLPEQRQSVFDRLDTDKLSEALCI